jgi:hypothetical protein
MDSFSWEYRSFGLKFFLGLSPGSFPILAMYVIDKEYYLQKHWHIVCLSEQVHIMSKHRFVDCSSGAVLRAEREIVCRDIRRLRVVEQNRISSDTRIEIRIQR